MPKRIFSGAQPTGNVHLGNYLGALRNWVALQKEYESFFCIVNLHAITVAQDPKSLAEKTRELARIYLAVGIDPEISTVFFPIVNVVCALLNRLPSGPSCRVFSGPRGGRGCQQTRPVNWRKRRMRCP